MELILKPTGRCNFSCSFCSAGRSKIQHMQNVSSELKEALEKISPSCIIVTGGDPLCVSPEFYEELLSLGSWKMSFTTNLKDYYENPGKWDSIFKNPRVGVCTSFQYGNDRRWDLDTVYDEEMFKKVFYKFLDDFGQRVKFLSVIGSRNEKRAIDHVLLAKELQTKCKLNPLMPLGKSREFYPMFKMVKIWLEVFQKGLQEWLDGDIQFKHGGCGFNTNLLCKSTIRAMMADEDGKLVIETCEDDLVGKKHRTDIPLSQKPEEEVIPLSEHINSQCIVCRLFRLCHGCHQAREINKHVEEHCREMKKLEDQIVAVGWAL